MGKKIYSKKKKPKCGIKIKNKSSSSKGKIREQKKEKIVVNIVKSIKDLILNLDDGKKVVNPQKSFKIIFGKKMSDRIFYENFRKGINYAKVNFSKTSLYILKKLLLILLDNKEDNIGDEFQLISSVNELHRTYKIDFIFSLIKEKKLNEYEKDKTEIESDFTTSEDYLLLKNTELFENAILYNANYEEGFSFRHFEQILYSSAVLNAYERALDELYEIKVKSTRIKNELKAFISSHQIYFFELSKKFYGLTLYDGTILLNKSYSNTCTHINVFIIFFNLIHELMHALSRILRGDNNYLLDTGDFVKKMKIEDSGTYFDNLLLLECLNNGELTKTEAKYLLKNKNYNFATVDEFKNAFIDFRNQNADKIKNEPKYKISKDDKEKYFCGIGNHCGFGPSRRFI